MLKIAKEAEENPEIVQEAPHSTYVKRLDETRAARKPILRYQKKYKKKPCCETSTRLFLI